jgi:putative Mn2+ efflux pump MntP
MAEPLVSLGELLVLALALAMDVFTVALGAGTSGHARSPRPALRLAFHCGLFQALMTILGWATGFSLERFLAAVDHWAALVVLAFVGVRMIRSGLSSTPGPRHVSDPTRGGLMVLVSFATSMDAFAVGLSLGFLRIGVAASAALIGAVSMGMGLLGAGLGGRLAARFGPRMEALGGVLLIAIGLRIVLAHLS